MSLNNRNKLDMEMLTAKEFYFKFALKAEASENWRGFLIAVFNQHRQCICRIRKSTKLLHILHNKWRSKCLTNKADNRLGICNEFRLRFSYVMYFVLSCCVFQSCVRVESCCVVNTLSGQCAVLSTCIVIVTYRVL